jgi:hypothetical protein
MLKSKKQNPQKQVFLSSENYIREKSRNLPIVQCLISNDWQICDLATIFIARQHTNGNFTFCFYLVDRACLGVKNTMYMFNQTQDALDRFKAKASSFAEFEEISYDLAHNIIFAAVKFAEAYGFKPHQDFTSVTRYFLEEDDDKIPLIAVHCGNQNGKPCYVNTGFHTYAQQQSIISQLEKTAGKGNYDIMINVGTLFRDDTTIR